jgi:hypothetical protein
MCIQLRLYLDPASGMSQTICLLLYECQSPLYVYGMCAQLSDFGSLGLSDMPGCSTSYITHYGLVEVREGILLQVEVLVETARLKVILQMQCIVTELRLCHQDTDLRGVASHCVEG